MLLYEELIENAKFTIVRSSLDISDLEFAELSSINGVILADIFYSDDKRCFSSKRAEVDGLDTTNGIITSILDISDGYILNGQTAVLNITNLKT